MARVMLALKTAFAAEDEIPVLVFDEVDANVGGETAHAVATKCDKSRTNVRCFVSRTSRPWPLPLPRTTK